MSVRLRACGLLGLIGLMASGGLANAAETRLYCVMHWADGSKSRIHNEKFTVDFDRRKVVDSDGDTWDAKISVITIQFDQLYKATRWRIAIDRTNGKITEATFTNGKYQPSLDRVGDCSEQ